tara:strand:+ start:224 stop:682 length:459 start_codon:yes stop_codon:yes gene_type:complete
MLLRNETIADSGLSPDRLTFLPSQALSLTPTSIDLTSVANTTAFSIASGQEAIIVGALLQVSAVAGYSTAPIVSIGTSPGPVGNNLFPAVSLAGLDTVEETWVFWNTLGGGILSSASVSGDTSDIIFSVTTAASATTLTADLYILGYLSNSS